MNWYKYSIYMENKELEKEAGLFSNLYSQIALAVSLLLGNASIIEAAESSKLPPGIVANIPIDALKRAKTNEEKREIMRNFMEGKTSYSPKTQKPKEQRITNIPQPAKPNPQQSTPQQQTKDTYVKDLSTGDKIVQLILKHENLLPKQTPFRITNDKMRQWNHIYGFEVDKNHPKTPRTRNFFYLKRSEDLEPAIKALFKKYITRYNDPTLEKALKIFDQEHPDAKISFILKRMPSVNMKAKLSTYF